MHIFINGMSSAKNRDCFDADEQYGDAPFPVLLHRYGLVEK
jgi:hypothetical protein